MFSNSRVNLKNSGFELVPSSTHLLDNDGFSSTLIVPAQASQLRRKIWIVAFMLIVLNLGLLAIVIFGLVALVQREVIRIVNPVDIFFRPNDESNIIKLIPPFVIYIGIAVFCINIRCFSRFDYQYPPFAIFEPEAIASRQSLMNSNERNAYNNALQNSLSIGFLTDTSTEFKINYHALAFISNILLFVAIFFALISMVINTWILSEVIRFGSSFQRPVSLHSNFDHELWLSKKRLAFYRAKRFWRTFFFLFVTGLMCFICNLISFIATLIVVFYKKNGMDYCKGYLKYMTELTQVFEHQSFSNKTMSCNLSSAWWIQLITLIVNFISLIVLIILCCYSTSLKPAKRIQYQVEETIMLKKNQIFSKRPLIDEKFSLGKMDILLSMPQVGSIKDSNIRSSGLSLHDFSSEQNLRVTCTSRDLEFPMINYPKDNHIHSPASSRILPDSSQPSAKKCIQEAESDLIKATVAYGQKLAYLHIHSLLFWWAELWKLYGMESLHRRRLEQRYFQKFFWIRRNGLFERTDISSQTETIPITSTETMSGSCESQDGEYNHTKSFLSTDLHQTPLPISFLPKGSPTKEYSFIPPSASDTLISNPGRDTETILQNQSIDFSHPSESNRIATSVGNFDNFRSPSSESKEAKSQKGALEFKQLSALSPDIVQHGFHIPLYTQLWNEYEELRVSMIQKPDSSGLPNWEN